MREWPRPFTTYLNAALRLFRITPCRWVEILSTGEEEVEVTESAVPGATGTWCTREMLRQWSGAIRERSSAWTSSSRAARPRCPSGSASTWPRS
ncbi:hypothetical protein F3K40_11650 [Streptomyces sp. LBUM 1478]|nr:hypothetical protein [Streptomyces sp. LBUM 1484]MBP5867691.1 hypothetical protein [Streptomyces sp. LBUM 1485]MBP5876175.1 hypothetical protein [Streptomyces sp. LBUM 1477]MBP5883912.1 hypothetical protein [Streptomyces sp. LBUM 1487]MBP5893284.1 hypothetical protein [Streptomyces sp. LBUM 1481]MBP5899928.1 hypothetical protein [Streptomyces sp. LBUM 1488]MBP5906258.1 hypothetical protein [Streptomyces sp. LBUM 1478]MBP5916501.1 hypothetical protein [Streptomyces sp. LBUM 1486]MBP592353